MFERDQQTSFRPKACFYDAQGSRETDAAAREILGVSGTELMQRAASAALTLLLQTYPSASALSVWCGKGHNGGDGYWLAAMAAERGLKVQVVSMHAADELVEETAQAHAQVAAQTARHEDYVPGETVPQGDVIVDALLGTGVSGAPREPYALALETLKESQLPIFSLDVPSGLDASTGHAEYALRARHTATFITRKVGLYTGHGAATAGDVSYLDLGVPETACAEPVALPLSFDPRMLPAIATDSYKHARGHVVVIGGDRGMPGAVTLAAEAALRAGAGLVTVVTHIEHAQIIVSRRPEVMVAPVEALPSLLEQADMLVFGCGLGRGDWGRDLFGCVQDSNCPVLIDADGLFHLAAMGTWAGGELYITPHSGEAARLLGLDGAAIEADRLSAAHDLQVRYHCTSVVLKGPGSVVYDGSSYICTQGNPGMATAGSGDVLAGIAGALLAGVYRQGVSPQIQFRQAVALHSAAGDAAAQQLGQRAMLASDIVSALPAVMETTSDV